MKLKFAVFVALVVIIITSCKKEMSFERSKDSNGVPNTPAGAVTDCKACIYVPYCTGSVYNYSDTAYGTPSMANVTLTFIKDTTIEGKTFQKFSAQAGSYVYNNCTTGITTSISYNGTTFGGGTITEQKAILLKANEPVGGTWDDQVINPAGDTSISRSTIIAKGFSKTVAGITYPDVIQVHSETIAYYSGTPITVGHAEYYFARGTGLIEAILTNDITGADYFHRVLISASIP